MRKAISSLSLASLLFLLAPAPAPAAAPAAATALAAPRTAELAREVTALLAKGDLDAVAARFSPQMAAALPAERFKQVWNGLPAQLGALKSLGAPVVRSEGGVESAWVPATYENAVVSLRMAFDAEGRLAGLRVLPGPPPAEWSAAPYADPAKAREREVTVGSGEWALPGTLTLPAQGSGPFPALVLVHGSGPQDRDETVGGTKVFRDLAGGLAARGVAVLRYEKRTRVHGAKMKGLDVTPKEEVVDDALAALALLRGEPGVDPRRVALLGHSLGGMLAPKIAGLDPRTAGIVVMAGNTRPPEELVADQVDHLVAVGAATAETAAATKADVARLRALSPGAPEAKTATLLGAPASYWLAFRGYDPAATAKGLAIPVLVLQGGRDYQVTSKDLDGWKAALGTDPRATIRLFPALNHLFVAGEGTSTPAEYERPGHVAPEVVEAIAAWTLALPPRARP
ncbi:MAG: alpha/beta fold hydrolase [Thermoanaerobaculia bacterium]